jgi:hypothetical protein
MPRGLKVSCPILANMIPFINIGNSLKEEKKFMTFRVAHWDTSYESCSF